MKPNFHAIKIKPYPATNKKGYRVGYISERFKQRIVVNESKLINSDSIKEKTVEFFERNGYNVIGFAEGGKDYDYLITDTFRPFTGKEWGIYYKGEKVDQFDTKAEARTMLKEYNMAFHTHDCKIKTVQIKLL